MLPIKTPRLLIDALTLADAELIVTMLQDPDLIAAGNNRSIHTAAQARQYILDNPLRNNPRLGLGMYALRRRNTGERIGLCSLSKRRECKDIDIGYGLLPAARGRGLALEAAQALQRYATEKLGLTRLSAVVAPDNTASIRLLEKLNLRYDREIQLTSSTAPALLYTWQT